MENQYHIFHKLVGNLCEYPLADIVFVSWCYHRLCNCRFLRSLCQNQICNMDCLRNVAHMMIASFQILGGQGWKRVSLWMLNAAELLVRGHNPNSSILSLCSACGTERVFIPEKSLGLILGDKSRKTTTGLQQEVYVFLFSNYAAK